MDDCNDEGLRRAGVLEVGLHPLAITARHPIAKRADYLPPTPATPAVSPNGDATAIVVGTTITIVGRDGRKRWSFGVP